MLIWFQYFSNDCSVPPQINNQQPTRLSDDAVPAKDTESWQAGLDQNLPGIPSANYITKSTNDASENVTKVTKIRPGAVVGGGIFLNLIWSLIITPKNLIFYISK